MTLSERIWFKICFLPLILLFVIIHSLHASWLILKTAFKFNKVNHFTDISCLTITGGHESIRIISENLPKIQKEFVANRIRKNH